MKQRSICKFCGQEKKLIKAHIIPRSFYLDYKHGQYTSVDSISGKFKIQQSGAYDKNILCADCDGKIIGEFDKEGSRILLKEVPRTAIYNNYDKAIYYLAPEHYNHKYLRNFFISILWRASISNLREFDIVHLGEYEDKALKILKGKEEYKNLFKTYIYKYPNGKDYNHFTFIGKSKVANHNAYVINMAGYFIQIILNGKNHPYNEIEQMQNMLVDDKGIWIFESEDLYNQHRKLAHNKMQEMWQKGFKPPFLPKSRI